MKLLEQIHWIGGIAPEADFISGGVSTDIFEVQGEGAVGILWVADATTGTYPTVKAYACDDTSASNSTEVAFIYKASTTFDTWGDWTQAVVGTGLVCNDSDDNMYVMFVPAAELASTGYKYLRFTCTETGASGAADGMLLCGVVNPRYQEVPSSLID